MDDGFVLARTHTHTHSHSHTHIHTHWVYFPLTVLLQVCSQCNAVLFHTWLLKKWMLLHPNLGRFRFTVLFLHFIYHRPISSLNTKTKYFDGGWFLKSYIIRIWQFSAVSHNKEHSLTKVISLYYIKKIYIL